MVALPPLRPPSPFVIGALLVPVSPRSTDQIGFESRIPGSQEKLSLATIPVARVRAGTAPWHIYTNYKVTCCCLNFHFAHSWPLDASPSTWRGRDQIKEVSVFYLVVREIYIPTTTIVNWTPSGGGRTIIGDLPIYSTHLQTGIYL